MQVTEAIDRFKHGPIEKVSDLSIQSSHVRLVVLWRHCRKVDLEIRCLNRGIGYEPTGQSEVVIITEIWGKWDMEVVYR